MSGDFGCTPQHFPLSSLYNRPLQHGVGLLAEETKNKNLAISLFRFISSHVSPTRKLAFRIFRCRSQPPPLAQLPSRAWGLYSIPYCAKTSQDTTCPWPLPECEGRSLRIVDLLLRPCKACLRVSLALLITHAQDCLTKNPQPTNLRRHPSVPLLSARSWAVDWPLGSCLHIKQHAPGRLLLGPSLCCRLQ